LIWFDDEVCCGSPSYYVQKLYAANLGSCTVKAASYRRIDCKINLFLRRTRDNSCIKRSISGIGKSISAFILTDNSKEDYNNLQEPEKVKTCNQNLTLSDWCYKSLANLFRVIRIHHSVIEVKIKPQGKV
jgi:hypothetical protein